MMPPTFSKIALICTIALAMHLTAASAGEDHSHEAGHTHQDVHVEDNGHGPAHRSRHGGQIVESGHHHLEVVVQDGRLRLYVVDPAGEPEDIKDAKASAAILSGGKKVDVVLVPEGDALSGVGEFKGGKGTVIVLTLTMPGHETEQARVKLD